MQAPPSTVSQKPGKDKEKTAVGAPSVAALPTTHGTGVAIASRRAVVSSDVLIKEWRLCCCRFPNCDVIANAAWMQAPPGKVTKKHDQTKRKEGAGVPSTDVLPTTEVAGVAASSPPAVVSYAIIGLFMAVILLPFLKLQLNCVYCLMQVPPSASSKKPKKKTDKGGGSSKNIKKNIEHAGGAAPSPDVLPITRGAGVAAASLPSVVSLACVWFGLALILLPFSKL